MSCQCKCKCDCGCGQPETCGLACPTRPRYYAGQMLTDRDLQAGVAWVRERLRLRRLVDGWGIVCGLQIQGISRTDRDLKFKVTPGYAISCCGEDIVVCKPIEIDLAKELNRPGCPPVPAGQFDVVLTPGACRLPQDPSREVEQGQVVIVPVVVPEGGGQPTAAPVPRVNRRDDAFRLAVGAIPRPAPAATANLLNLYAQEIVAAATEGECASCDADDRVVLGRITVTVTATERLITDHSPGPRTAFPMKTAVSVIGRPVGDIGPGRVTINLTDLIATPRPFVLAGPDLVPVVHGGRVIGHVAALVPSPAVPPVAPPPNPGGDT